ncbi:phosphatidylcholine/phosphatidylserine synthase [Promethearchaeum syntrophicum]|uniref:Phosphatidylcholine/phosphatidylserine synthase n=1 Tax=Promethearchaeum syntrophicum TaxID=2594042 RepID=A0A5B9DD23_9ARCH|nr:CDP-alcohol phosphatidyltransferase family protein [Candidatus Prometheoarchaeum syntrophicum]QEE17128.1 Archaetidylserine synthase [Candidatus Prometheoarchaeum syntrophicum]
MGMLSIIKIKDIATLIGSACGFFAIILTISEYHAYRLAMAMIFIAIITDTLDGYLARKLNQANEFGKELDSLSDFFAFGFAPAIITFYIYTQTTTSMGIKGFSIWVMFIPTFIFILGAIIRLAHFNCTELEGYVGVPTPTTAGFLSLITLIDYYFYIAYGSTHLFNQIIHYSIPFILILLAWFNVTDKISFSKKVRHKKGWLKILMVIVLVTALTAYVLIIFFENQAAVFVFIILTLLLTIVILLIISGFISAIKEKKQKL